MKKTEKVDAIDFYTFVDMLDECGWAYSGFEVLEDYVLYRLEEYRPKHCQWDELKEKIMEVAPSDNCVKFLRTQCQYAPEIRRHAVKIGFVPVV